MTAHAAEIQSPMLDAALGYADRGWRVIPQYPNTKIPRGKKWQLRASSDPDQVTSWWSSWPDSNVAIVCGPESNLLVMDVDIKNDNKGLDTLADLKAEHGALNTWTVSTPSGGCHLYFQYPTDLLLKNRQILPGIEIRVANGAVSAPPSIIDDKSYQLTADFEPLPCPDWLSELAVESTVGSISHNPLKSLQGVTQGERNTFIFLQACHLRARGLSKKEAKLLLLELAADCSPPLPISEVMSCLKSAWKYNRPYPANDSGNAKRLVKTYGERIRFAVHSQKWLVRDGPLWTVDQKGEITSLAKSVPVLIMADAQKQQDESRQKALGKFALGSGNRKRLDDMIRLAQSEDGISIGPDEIDADRYLLGTPEGVLDLSQETVVETDQIVTKRTGARYDPDGQCPQWQKFLSEIFDGDQALIDFIQRSVGYSLTGLTSEQCLFFCWGSGANGKSTFINVIRRVLGDYSQILPSTALMSSRLPDNPAIARLQGARFAVAAEVADGSRFNETLLKQLTGGDKIAARFLYRDYFEFVPQFKLWIMGNHLPEIRGTDEAIWRRIRLIPFRVTIPEAERDPNLENRLLEEADGILNWAVAGFDYWYEAGLCPPNIVTEATSKYRSDMDVLGEWFDKHVVMDPAAETSASTLYFAYRKWAEENGEFVLSQTKLARQLSERNIRKRKSGGKIVYKGVTLEETDKHGYPVL